MFRLFGGIRRLITALLRLIVVPFRALIRGSIRLSQPAYRLLFAARHRSERQPGASPFAKLLQAIASRQALPVMVVILAVSVAANNVAARGGGLADVTTDSVLSHVISPNPFDEDVIERAPAPKIAYLNRASAISPDVGLEAEIGGGVEAEEAISASGNALQIPLTVSDDIQQRSDVTSYVVQGGDTIGGIANRFGITQKTILAANNMSNADFIKPGQELLIPPITGVLHKIVRGDTIASIAAKYKVDAQEILDFNHLADPSAIAVDQTIMVPGGELPDLQPERPAIATPGTPRSSTGGPVPGPAPAIGGGKLNWPTVGRRVNQYFRYGHTGIDAECRYSDPLYAARGGTVSAVIYQRYGYGYHIIINHGGGLQTLYGHASKIFVKPGQSVKQGQTIAMCGSTGRSTGTHVHLETIVNGRKVNPLTYL